VSSLRRGHANLLCIVPILTDETSLRGLPKALDEPCSYELLLQDTQLGSVAGEPNSARGPAVAGPRRFGGASRRAPAALLQLPPTIYYVRCGEPSETRDRSSSRTFVDRAVSEPGPYSTGSHDQLRFDLPDRQLSTRQAPCTAHVVPSSQTLTSEHA